MIFSSDTFTDTAGVLLQNHTGEVGATWVKHASGGVQDMKITDANMLRASSTGLPAIYYASGVPGTAEYDVQTLVTQRSSGSSPIGVAGRIDSVAHTLYAAMYEPAFLELIKVVAGSQTSLGNFNLTIGDGNSVTLKLEIRDATKRVFIDGVQRISSADNVITTAGLAGVRGKSGGDNNTTGSHLDNFVATDLTSGIVATSSDTPIFRIGRGSVW